MSFVDEIKQEVNNYIDRVAISHLEDKVKVIMREREELKRWTDKELSLATVAFRQDLQKGTKLDSLIVPAFAVVNEAARRILGKTPYEVQILAGLVIHTGKVAEMKAGEGKTLMETMPVYLNALEGKGVHLITTNDYLAERDATEMGKLYNFLGLTVGYVTSEMENEARRKAYSSDITYVANQEVGFDFLRDNLVYSRADRVLRQQHPLHFGIVDEVDSILIDESRTPLIIAEPVKEERNYYDMFTQVARKLKEGEDYTVDYVHKNVTMTDQGLNAVEKITKSPMFGKENPMYVFYLDVCIKAKILFEKDRDYIITPEGAIEIVDEFTGRVLPGRRFTDGVHQAIEAKENVKVKESDRTQAAITFQNFFPMYEKLSGMSGTVMGARDEFGQVYKLDVIQIPTNRPLVRIDMHDLFFKTWKGKMAGLMKKVRQIHKKGQPLLIGARNVETAHEIAELLEYDNLPYQMLTAADHKEEAEKIGNAGQTGMITVATNMAGRGTDILLGDGVEALGGLFVLGTERHESRRIDDQLVGRSGRQGEPGGSQILISMEDEIMQLFGSEKIIDTMEQYDIPEDEYISGKTLDQAFARAQKFVESRNYDSRIYLYKYDSVIHFQLKYVYSLRDSLLENPPAFMEFLKTAVQEIVKVLFKMQDPKLVRQELQDVFLLDLSEEELTPVFLPLEGKSLQGWDVEEIQTKFSEYLLNLALRIQQDAQAFEAAHHLVLQVIDTQWSEHLDLMDVLKEESGLFSYASQDPLIDYVLESRRLFEHMTQSTYRKFLKSIFLFLSQKNLLN
jgi:preprotein translocase subunit SecA